MKAMDESKASTNMGLPGFRFHPTEEELLNFYLKNTISGKNNLHYNIIDILNIYRHDPWCLPGLAKIGEREWYFFVPRDTKHGNGGRPNRTTEHGFWKATGSDRNIFSLSEPKRAIGLKKTLVFYKGRAPRGTKTDWVMNEYRLPDSFPSNKDMVLCKIYRKATSLKVLEQRAAMEKEMKSTNTNSSADMTPPPSPLSPPISMETVSNEDSLVAADSPLLLKKEKEGEEENFVNYDVGEEARKSLNLQLPIGMEKMELQLPKCGSPDPFNAPLCSPWLDNWLIPYANVLDL